MNRRMNRLLFILVEERGNGEEGRKERKRRESFWIFCIFFEGSGKEGGGESGRRIGNLLVYIIKSQHDMYVFFCVYVRCHLVVVVPRGDPRGKWKRTRPVNIMR